VNEATKPKRMASASRKRKPIMHRFIHHCRSGNLISMTLESWGPGRFGEYEITWAGPASPHDAEEYRAWFVAVEDYLTAKAGHRLKLMHEPVR